MLHKTGLHAGVADRFSARTVIRHNRVALVKYVVGREPSCDFLDTEGQTWPDQIAAVTG